MGYPYFSKPPDILQGHTDLAIHCTPVRNQHRTSIHIYIYTNYLYDYIYIYIYTYGDSGWITTKCFGVHQFARVLAHVHSLSSSPGWGIKHHHCAECFRDSKQQGSPQYDICSNSNSWFIQWWSPMITQRVFQKCFICNVIPNSDCIRIMITPRVFQVFLSSTISSKKDQVG